jgi:hypothetical protein
MTDDQSIAIARGNLTAKLTELRRRETQARSAISPLRYLANPWVHVGIAAFVGYRLGRPRAGAAAPILSTPGPTFTRTIVRAGVVAIAEAIVRRVAGALVESRG